MSAIRGFPVEPIRRTPWWLRLFARKPAKRQWIWTWMGWGINDGYWKYTEK